LFSAVWDGGGEAAGKADFFRVGRHDEQREPNFPLVDDN
jgi:hypothetical protein